MSSIVRTRGTRRSDLAHRRLHRMLLRGEVPDNGRLVEEDIGRMLGMGRAPVREALLRLEADGLVEGAPNAGFRVRRLTRRDLCDLYEIRIALESLAIRMICRRRVSARTLAAMRRLCDAMEELGRRGKWREADHKDLRFHRRLITLARSSQLEMAIRASHLGMVTWNRVLNEQQRVVDAQRSSREHRIIIEHIGRGEAEQAAAALGDHLRNGLTGSLAVFSAKGLGPDEPVSPDSVGRLAQNGRSKSSPRLADSDAAPEA